MTKTKYFIANFYTTPHYDLYRRINELKTLNKWQEIIDLSTTELSVNCDLFILARLMEALCVQNGIDGLSESFDIMNSCNDTMFDTQNPEYHRIMSWIDNYLWFSIFKNTDFLKNDHKCQLLENLINKIPPSLVIMKSSILYYIESHNIFTVINDTQPC